MEVLMGDLLIRDVDEQLMHLLKSKAEVNGTSLQQEAKKALKKGAPLTGEERGKIFDELRKELGGFPKVATSGADLIREVREEES
jgi:plasmid stability protein